MYFIFNDCTFYRQFYCVCKFIAKVLQPFTSLLQSYKAHHINDQQKYLVRKRKKSDVCREIHRKEVQAWKRL